MEEVRAKEQRSASLKQNARQSRLTMEADVTAKKTRERTEDAAAAVQASMRIAALQKGSKSAQQVRPVSA